MYVRNRMTKNPYTISPDATALDTLELMKDKKIKRVPVIKNGKIVGIVTEKTLLEITPRPMTTLNKFDIKNYLTKLKVEGIMSKNVITTTPSTLLEEAALLMRNSGIGGLPVVDGEKLVGIITESDIFKAFLEIMGVGAFGSRIALEIENNKPGILAMVAGIIAEKGINITRLAIYENELIIMVDTTDIKGMLDDLRNHGFKVISVIKND